MPQPTVNSIKKGTKDEIVSNDKLFDTLHFSDGSVNSNSRKIHARKHF